MDVQADAAYVTMASQWKCYRKGVRVTPRDIAGKRDTLLYEGGKEGGEAVLGFVTRNSRMKSLSSEAQPRNGR